MSTTPTQLAFRPWLRYGASPDLPASGTHAKWTRTLEVTETKGGVAETTGGVVNTNEVAVRLSLIGPGEVLGLNPTAIKRRYPAPRERDVPWNFFPLIEFYEADLPWRYSPDPGTDGGGERVKPWLTLLVLRSGGQGGAPEFTWSEGKDPLPRITVSASVLPDLAESWAFAHEQADPPCSRILATRKLEGGAEYTALLVPTYERGRVAGTTATTTRKVALGNVAAEKLAWAYPDSDENGATVELPVYHHWTFTTSTEKDDFEGLLTKLTATAAPENLGTRKLEVAAYGVRAVTTLEGALLPPTYVPTPWRDRAALANALLPEDTDPRALPVLGPPLRGVAHTRKAIDPGRSPGWLEELNLAPEWRTVAGYGATLVQQHQEAFMAAAWEVAEEIRSSIAAHNRRVQRLLGTNRLHRRLFKDWKLRAPVLASMMLHRRLMNQAKEFAIADFVWGVQFVRQLSVRGPLRRSPVAAQLGPEGLTTLRLTLEANTRVLELGAPVTSARLSDTLKEIGTELSITIRGGLGDEVLDLLRPGLPELDIGFDPISGTIPTNRLSPMATIPPAMGAMGSGGSGHFAMSGSLPPGSGGGGGGASAPPSGTSAGGNANATAGSGSKDSTTVGPSWVSTLQSKLAGAIPRPPPTPEEDPFVEFLRNLFEALSKLATTQDATEVAAEVSVGNPSDSELVSGEWAPVRYPVFEDAAAALLASLAPSCLVPGLQGLEVHQVTALRSNPAFETAVLAGMNHEMMREFAWRRYPSDGRGSPFSRFWGLVPGGSSSGEDEAPMDEWDVGTSLAEVTGAGSSKLVLFFNSPLFTRYPNTRLYLCSATNTEATESSSSNTVNPNFSDETPPLFGPIRVGPCTAVGFDLSIDEAEESRESRFVVFEQAPGDPLFGADVSGESAGESPFAPAVGKPHSRTRWNNLSWGHIASTPAGWVQMALRGQKWSYSDGTPSGAQFAACTFQAPVRKAILLDDLLQKPTTSRFANLYPLLGKMSSFKGHRK